MWRCHYCSLPLSLEMQSKHTLCPGCSTDLHSCKNCIHFSENETAACKEPESPWIGDRLATNECPFFEFRRSRPSSLSQPQEPSPTEAEKAKQAFKALFRNVD
jgi:hypothetical protein